MAKQLPTISYFRCRLNDKAPLFEAKFAHDVEAMRKHVDFFECDKDGKALDGVSVSLPKHGSVPAEEETVEAVVEAAPAPKPAPKKAKK